MTTLLQGLLSCSGLQPFRLNGRSLLPIVQGGMGIGVSAHRLAGNVAALGAMGTIAAADLRHHHPDLLERTASLPVAPESKATIDRANIEALSREIRAAREIACGNGLLAVNVMRAVSEYSALVRTALECGIDAVVVGAGLPLDLPDLAKDHPSVSLIPILSDARGIQLIVKKWERKGRLPSAIVIEHPRHAGGHLGATQLSDVNDPRFDFEHVLPTALAFLRSAGVEAEVPLIAAGGVRSFADIKRLQSLGAAAVQLGTPFAVTEECDAHINFKRVLADASAQDIVEFVSVAGLPARAVASTWTKNYLRVESTLKQNAHTKTRCTKKFDCLVKCGLRDGIPEWGQFCIDNQLAAALKGDVKKGLFFRGAGALPFGAAIRPVRELLAWMLTPPFDPIHSTR
jgi:nitronate monooxygenase